MWAWPNGRRGTRNKFQALSSQLYIPDVYTTEMKEMCIANTNSSPIKQFKIAVYSFDKVWNFTPSLWVKICGVNKVNF